MQAVETPCMHSLNDDLYHAEKTVRWAASPTCSLKAFPKGGKYRRVIATGVAQRRREDEEF